MNTKTINISLPKKMYQDAKMALADRGYSSVSELMRDALRKQLYPELTENGFTPEFEEMVLRAENEPDEPDVWETEEDVHRFFEKLKRETKNKKNAKG